MREPRALALLAAVLLLGCEGNRVRLGGAEDALAGTGGSGGSTAFIPPTCAKGSTARVSGAPVLQPGVWKNISPPGADQNLTEGLALDPCNPSTLYVTAGHPTGLWRSLDAGSTWDRIHDFDGINGIRVDPDDPLHLYVTDTAGGNTNGFWVSHDGGATFELTAGFQKAANSVSDFNVCDAEVDPADFKHVLVSFNYFWDGGNNAGLFETTDGGETSLHNPDPGWADVGNSSALFLYNPKLGIGDDKTWLYGSEGKGYWRTTDAGSTWVKVSDVSKGGGGVELYYTAAGVLYVSGNPSILRSMDNGVTWTEVAPANDYLSVIGDGNFLYSGDHVGGPFRIAPENNDTMWTDYNTQTFLEGPIATTFDAANRILYSSNVTGGVWALQVLDP